MRLRLRDPSSFWMLMDDQQQLIIHLTPDTPGPIEVDPAALSEEQLAAVRRAVQFRILVTDEAPAAAPPPRMALNDYEAPTTMAARLLKHSAKVLQDLIPTLTRRHRAVLEAMLELEQQGVNAVGYPRKTVVRQLEQLLAHCGGVGQVIDEPGEVCQVDLEESSYAQKASR